MWPPSMATTISGFGSLLLKGTGEILKLLFQADLASRALKSVGGWRLAVGVHAISQL